MLQCGHQTNAICTPRESKLGSMCVYFLLRYFALVEIGRTMQGNFNFLSLDVILFFLLDMVVVAVECYMITYHVFLFFLVICSNILRSN